MVDIDAAIGFVVAHGDAVDRARLSGLRTGAAPPEEVLVNVEGGQLANGGWPAGYDTSVASVDATCFRLAEIDDLNGLDRPAAKRALDWLAKRQRLDGFWEEDAALADSAPPWARPGDPDARYYLTANAAFWLAVASPAASFSASSSFPASSPPSSLASESSLSSSSLGSGSDDSPLYDAQLTRAAQALRDALDDTGAWPGFLISGWLAAAVLHRTEWFYESARIQFTLTERIPTMSASDVAWMVAALRRVGANTDESLLAAARNRLDKTQRSDGGWPSDDAPALDVHTTLTALRALLP
jgi:hypothetical protein